jgi:hypothetical protein
MNVIYCAISAGLLTFFVVRICPDPPCPRWSLKDIIAFVFAVIGAIIYFQIAKLGMGAFSGEIHFINGHIAGLALGAAVRSGICPIK